MKPPSVIEAEAFSLDCFWAFSFSSPRVSVPGVYFTLDLFRLLVFFTSAHFSFPVFAFCFLKPNFMFPVIFIVLHTFVLLAALPVLRASYSLFAGYIYYIYISFASACSPFCGAVWQSIHVLFGSAGAFRFLVW